MTRTIADEIVCQCAQVRASDIDRLKREAPGITFDEVLQRSNAGTRCTACLLDVEYRFTMNSDSELATDGHESVQLEVDQPSRGKRSLRQAIYSLLDTNLAPKFRRRTYFAPVFLHEQIEQLCVLSNQEFTFATDERVPPYRIELTLRNNGGDVVAKEAHDVAAGEHFERSVSALFPESTRKAKTLAVGSITTTVEPRSTGLMGFPRPHIKLLTARGASSVHQHSPLRFREGYVTWINQPGLQRIFLAFVNTWPWPVSCELDYPHGLPAPGAPELVRESIHIPSRGAVVHELTMAPYADANAPAMRFSSRLRASVSTGTVHMIYATPDLSALSVDHVIFR